MEKGFIIDRAKNALSAGRSFVCGVPVAKEHYDWVQSHHSGDPVYFLVAKTVPQNWHLPPGTSAFYCYVSDDVKKPEAWQSTNTQDIIKLLGMSKKIHYAPDGIIYRGKYNGGFPTVIAVDSPGVKPILKNFDVRVV